MNKSEVREAVRAGKITLGIMRKALNSASAVPSWSRSSVNKTMTKSQALEVLIRAVAADTRPDDTVMNGSNRDVLIATNVIRECGFSATI